MVDDADYELASQYKWYAGKRRTGEFSAMREKSGRTRYLHRLIMGMADSDKRPVDHIDHNPLNNTRANLRICTQSQNCMNRTKPKNASSKYKGVSLNKQFKKPKWRAYIRYESLIYLGDFDSEKDAAIAYDKAAKRIFGEYAHLNFKEGA